MKGTPVIEGRNLLKPTIVLLALSPSACAPRNQAGAQHNQTNPRPANTRYFFFEKNPGCKARDDKTKSCQRPAPRMINEAISGALIVFGSPICLRPPLRNTTPMASKTSAISRIKINFVTNSDTGSTHIAESFADRFCIGADQAVELLLNSSSDESE